MIDLNYMAAKPEIWLALASMALLMLGVFRGDGFTKPLAWLGAAALVVTAWLVWSGTPEQGRNLAFNGLFVVDSFGGFMKILSLLATAVAIIMTLGYAEREGMKRFELPILMMISALGMIMMISANDLISLYVGLELQSLALYVVAAFRRDTVRSTEAGLKYFVLGALSSGMLLYGASMI